MKKTKRKVAQGPSPFDGYIVGACSALDVLPREHGFSPASVAVRIPACSITYESAALRVEVTYEYPGVPFCVLTIEREDGRMVRVGFGKVAERLGFGPWNAPSTSVEFDVASQIVASNLTTLVGVIDAIRRSDIKSLMHDELWRQFS
jgi:hypothetical protein